MTGLRPFGPGVTHKKITEKFLLLLSKPVYFINRLCYSMEVVVFIGRKNVSYELRVHSNQLNILYEILYLYITATVVTHCDL